MKKSFVWLLGLAFSFNAMAVTVSAVKSAAREPGVSYRAYVGAVKKFSAESLRPPPSRTPVDSAQSYDKAVLPPATVWESEEVMLERFRQLRDHRFLTRSSRPNFARRSSWLYPDDGCFARAQLANRNLFNWGVPTPSKLFVFGDLEVRTVNSPSGSVSWWYHVVPVVEVNGQKYALDPAIEPSRPLTIQEWLARQSQAPGTLEVAICNSGSYTPYDSCDTVINKGESQAESDQGSYLDDEWSRLEELGRNPERELGDNPPW